jgi:hypothetical protein
MDSALDFTRWTEKPLGVGYRRRVIAENELRQLFRMKLMRGLVFFAWFAGLLLAALGFLFAQSITAGGWLETLGARFGPRGEAIASAFTALVLLYPDIVVQGAYTLLFWAHSHVALLLSLVALTVVVPRLVTRDRAGNALTMYLSRPITAFDYRIGKLLIIVGVLVVLWTGPLVGAWLISVLFAPDRLFIVHSLAPMGDALLFNVVSLVALAAIAFGVSAVSRSANLTTFLWIALWVIVGGISRIPFTPDWLRYLSFRYNLEQIQLDLFEPGRALLEARDVIPLLGPEVVDALGTASETMRVDNLPQAWIGLGLLAGVSLLVFFFKLRPE